jgi:branched-chain amino acid transport system permease protein
MLKRLLLIRGAEFLIFALLAAVPLAVMNPYALGLLTLLAIYGILLIGLDISVGYLGQLNLAQVAYLGLGAYTAGLCVTRLGWGVWLAMLAAIVVCTLLGALLALPALRLEGPQFALATLSFTALTATALNELEWLTNGAQGLSFTRPPVFGHPLTSAEFYWLCVAMFAVVWMAMRNLLASHWGRAFEALRDSPIATDAMGVGTYRYKVAGFALGSALGGLAGALYAFNFQFLQPQTFVYELTVVLLLGVVLGGRKSLWGAFVGASLVALLPNLLSNRFVFEVISGIGLLVALVAGIRKLVRKTTQPFQAIAPIVSTGMLVVGGLLVENTEDWRKAIFALILFSVVVGLPEGLMGFAARFLSKLFRIEPPPLPAPAPLDSVIPQRAAAGAAPLLQIRHLKRYFGGVKAVDGVSMTVGDGQIHGLVGPNGSGKTTLVNVVSGLYTATAGELLLRGQPLPQGSLFKTARAGVARTFQNLQLFTGLTALDNVMVALRGTYRRSRSLPLVLLGLGRIEEKRAQAEALALLEFVGLRDQARTPAKDLTYGAQRFLEIARALARKPDLLILDEPAAGLAHPDVRRQMEIIQRVHRRGVTILLIEHHMDVVRGLCDVVTVLDSGKVIAEGTADEIKRDKKVIEAYLGDVEGAPKPQPTLVRSPQRKDSRMLVVEDLHAGYGLSEVLHGTALEVKTGTVVALLGANGAGKTTTMRAISGVIKPTRGRVVLDGRPVQGQEASRIARLGLAHAPEGRRVFGPLSVEDNLLLGAYRRLPRFFGFGALGKTDLERVYTLFPRLRERKKQAAGTLSGGEQQMLAIGRALMARPKVMLLDEPSMGLAPVIVQEVLRTIETLKQEGMTMLLVEQFANTALEVADHAYVMEGGKIAIDGPPEELRKNERVLAAYLG